MHINYFEGGKIYKKIIVPRILFSYSSKLNICNTWTSLCNFNFARTAFIILIVYFWFLYFFILLLLVFCSSMNLKEKQCISLRTQVTRSWLKIINFGFTKIFYFLWLIHLKKQKREQCIQWFYRRLHWTAVYRQLHRMTTNIPGMRIYSHHSDVMSRFVYISVSHVWLLIELIQEHGLRSKI